MLTALSITDAFKPYAKAIVAGISVAIATAIALASDGINLVDGLTISGAFLAGAFPTWAVPNAVQRPRNEAGNLEPGSAAIGLIVGLLVAYLILR